LYEEVSFQYFHRYIDCTLNKFTPSTIIP
jgi:hypothetical protein